MLVFSFGYFDGFKTDSSVHGYASKAEDVSQLTTYDEIFNGLRLDYPNSAYKPDTYTCLGVIRFTSPDVDGLTVPYSPAMGGSVTDAPSFTGNRFLASAVDIIPEFKRPCSMSLMGGAELNVIQKDGTISVIAEFSSDAGRFIPIN